MKIKSFLLLSLAAFLGFSACGDDTEYVEPSLEVSTATIAVEASVGSASFTLTSNRDWNITKAADWVDVSPSYGAECKDFPITVTILANENEDPREAILTITASSLKKTVSITQKGKGGAAITYITINDLYKRYDASGVSGETAYVITDDVRLTATCIYDLAGGNSTSLKNAYLQDNTGGLAIRTDANNGYTSGDQVTIKLKDASLAKYQGVGKPQLQFNVDNASVVAGTMPAPVELTIDQIVKDAKYHSTYVKLKDVQFVKYAGLTYHDASSTYSATSRTVTSCGDNTIDVRTSKYAAFCNDTLPKGKGDLLGIVTMYQYTGGDIVWQFLLSNAASDDAMSNDISTRCGGGSTGEGIPATATKVDIATVVGKFATGAVYEGDNYIEGEVLANPANGNVPSFVVYIADATGGIALTLSDEQEIIEEAFPVGGIVKVYVNGAKYNLYNGLIQLGDGDTISASKTAITEAKATNPLAPIPVKITDLVERAYQGQLVKIDPVQFSKTGQAFKASNNNIEDADGNSIQVYTRTNATFAETQVPSGSGAFIGIVSNYNKPQLLIRNPNDLVMTGERFAQQTEDPAKASLMSIADVIALSNGDITANIKIKGVVTSDVSTQNLASGNMYIQDASGAIALRFSEHNVAMGQEIEVWLYGANRNTFNGLQQVQSLAPANILSQKAGTMPEPKEISIAQLNTGNYQSQLVKIAEVQFSDPSVTYSGSQTIADRTGATAAVYTRADATFSGNTVAAGSGPIIGHASVYTTVQLILRNVTDVAGMTGARFQSETPSAENATLISIADLRLIPEAESISQNVKIKGVVTSDVTSQNLAAGNMYIQDASGAIALRFTEAVDAYTLGKELEIWVYGATRGNYNGLDQVSNLSLAQVIASADGTLPNPAEISLEQALVGNYESRLVKISNVQFADVSKAYKDSPVLQDANAKTLTVYTRSAATFAGETVAEKSGSITGVMSVFNGAIQLILRNLTDVAGMTAERFTPTDPGPGPTGGSGVFFSEYLEGSSGNNKYLELYNPTSADIVLNGYTVVLNTNGGETWNEKYAGSLDGVTIKAGQTLVLKHSQGTFYTGEGFSPAGNNGLSFNGNDPVGLFRDGKLVDIIGVFKGGSADFAKDVVLRRKASVKEPYVSSSQGWDPAQWDTATKDDVSDLGKHTIN